MKTYSTLIYSPTGGFNQVGQVRRGVEARPSATPGPPGWGLRLDQSPISIKNNYYGNQNARIWPRAPNRLKKMRKTQEAVFSTASSFDRFNFLNYLL